MVPAGWTNGTATVEIDWTSDHAACNNEWTDTVCWSLASGSVANSGAFSAPSYAASTPQGINSTCHGVGESMHASVTGYDHGLTDAVLKLSQDVASSFVSGCTSDSFPQEARLVGVRICKE